MSARVEVTAHVAVAARPEEFVVFVLGRGEGHASRVELLLFGWNDSGRLFILLVGSDCLFVAAPLAFVGSFETLVGSVDCTFVRIGHFKGRPQVTQRQQGGPVDRFGNACHQKVSNVCLEGRQLEQLQQIVGYQMIGMFFAHLFRIRLGQKVGKSFSGVAIESDAKDGLYLNGLEQVGRGVLVGMEGLTKGGYRLK